MAADLLVQLEEDPEVEEAIEKKFNVLSAFLDYGQYFTILNEEIILFPNDLAVKPSTIIFRYSIAEYFYN